jgi:hypothetical protein
VKALASGMKQKALAIGSLLLALQAMADPGPYLFLDEQWIARSSGLTRKVQQPIKYPQPVLDNKTFGVTQPFVTVLREPESGLLRIWYCRGSQVWQATSKDGVSWSDAHVAYARGRGYGASIIDDKGRDPNPARRFKLADWSATPAVEDTEKDDGGMYVAFSPDNAKWTRIPANPVLASWPAGYGKYAADGVSDIIDAFYDPIQQRYAAAVKLFSGPGDPWSRGTRLGTSPGTRRIVGMTISPDFVHWEKPWRIIVPDARDQGDMEFYGLGGVHARGSLLIGFVRVLRDDLPCDAGGTADGVGYTTLAWSRDGRTWTRDHETFIPRDPKPGAWDHAMAWGSSAIQVGGELFIYYGGYARGHKIESGKERQIGLARMPVDRYFAREAGPDGGTLLTPPLALNSRRLTVNADVQGELRVRLLLPGGKPVPGYDWGDCRPITGNPISHEVSWGGKHSALPHRASQIEFSMKRARLFGFGLEATSTSSSK